MSIEDLKPGSYGAQGKGCSCPVLDNRNATEGTFIFDLNCPLHSRKKAVDPDLVEHVAKALDTDGWVSDEELAEMAIHASLTADPLLRLYTKREVGDAQAFEADYIARSRDETIHRLRKENDNLRHLLSASRLCEAIVDSGMFVRKDDDE